jgi:hypothetical protein
MNVYDKASAEGDRDQSSPWRQPLAHHPSGTDRKSSPIFGQWDSGAVPGILLLKDSAAGRQSERRTSEGSHSTYEFWPSRPLFACSLDCRLA